MATKTNAGGDDGDDAARLARLALEDAYVVDRHGERVALLTIAQAAEFLKVSRRTFFRLRETYDDFPTPVRWLERGVRYLESDLADWTLRRSRR